MSDGGAAGIGIITAARGVGGPPSPTPLLFHLLGARPARWLGLGLTSQAAPVSALTAVPGERNRSCGPGCSSGKQAASWAGAARPEQKLERLVLPLEMLEQALAEAAVCSQSLTASWRLQHPVKQIFPPPGKTRGVFCRSFILHQRLIPNPVKAALPTPGPVETFPFSSSSFSRPTFFRGGADLGCCRSVGR